MRVFISNNCGHAAKKMVQEHPDRIGWLMGPSSWKTPLPGMTYALDNDAFSAWTNGTEWDESAWRRHLDKSKAHRTPPLWALVPDLVGSKDGTLERWAKYWKVVVGYGFAPAFAAQDGMSPGDIPGNAEVLFIGGTTEWKWSSLPMWVKHHPRVHVGRVRQRRLLTCEEFKVESCDGTGWFREGQTGKPARYLWAWLNGNLGRTSTFDFYHQTANT